MAVDYDALATDELLDALAMAGRAPDLDLLRACLARREAITPGLLHSLAATLDDDWPDDDPRAYAGIHAGMLLIAFREPAALPIFADILWDDAMEDVWAWFDTELPAYGPAIVPWAIELLDDDYGGAGRSCAANMLLEIAREHPSERERIVQALRRHLPPLGEDGRLAVTRGGRLRPDPIWTWAAGALTELGDTTSAAQAKALHAEGLADQKVEKARQIVGMLRAAAPDAPRQRAGDILHFYEALRRRAEEAGRDASEGEDAGGRYERGIVNATDSDTVEMLLTAFYEGTDLDGPWLEDLATAEEMEDLSYHEGLGMDVPYHYLLLTLADDKARTLTREAAQAAHAAADRLLGLLDAYEEAALGEHPEWAKFIAMVEAPFAVEIPPNCDTRDPDVVAVMMRDVQHGGSWRRMLGWLARHGSAERQRTDAPRVCRLAAFEEAYGVDLADLLFSEAAKAEHAEMAEDLEDDSDLPRWRWN